MSTLSAYELYEVGVAPRPTTRPIPDLAEDEVLIEVAGCGLCHTDLGFAYDGVRTRQPLPLVLGHEISGVVRATGAACADWLGAAVVVPAVIPCGACDDCLAGAPMICGKQVMPGNDRDGGFASHVVMPARGLCRVPGFAGDVDAPLGASKLTLRHLAVIADAVSTPYQAIARAGLQPGQVAVVIGLGGVGGYAAQIAAARGAKVVGIDINADRLAAVPGLGLAINPRDLAAKDIKKQIAAYAASVGAPKTRQVLLECSGSTAGQALAFDLLVHGATLCVVGFTMGKLELRLSNLMAFDARALGNWGCAPALYPEIVDLALSGAINLADQVEFRPLSSIAQAFDDAHHHRVGRRVVLVP